MDRGCPSCCAVPGPGGAAPAPRAFRGATYAPLEAAGSKRRHVVAFVRGDERGRRVPAARRRHRPGRRRHDDHAAGRQLVRCDQRAACARGQPCRCGEMLGRFPVALLDASGLHDHAARPRVWAPNAEAGRVASGRRRVPMTHVRDGGWCGARPPAERARTTRSRSTAASRVPDPRSPWQPDGSHGPSRWVDHDALRVDRRRLARPPPAGGRRSTSCTSARSRPRERSTARSSASTTSSTWASRTSS